MIMTHMYNLVSIILQKHLEIEKEREDYETGEGKGGRENERLPEKVNSYVYSICIKQLHF